jgi:pimeloyl-ACP methyl ester carboxylesterase
MAMNNDASELRASDSRAASVESHDGTSLHYRTLGQGPGIVLLHGAMECGSSHLRMATALADGFTVHLPDRRGRGRSGPYGDDYGIRREVEDLAALLAATGAQDVFGVSAGGLVALEAALTLPAIRRIALYEPALLMAGSSRTSWLARFDDEMGRGRTAAALITSMKGLSLGPPILGALPRRLLEAMIDKSMRREEERSTGEGMTMREYAPTLHYEGQLMAEMTGTLERFRAVTADVLLLGGSKGLPFLEPSLTALASTLPSVERIEFPGLHHGGSSDDSATNRGGKPEIVARELRRFFA